MMRFDARLPPVHPETLCVPGSGSILLPNSHQPNPHLAVLSLEPASSPSTLPASPYGLSTGSCLSTMAPRFAQATTNMVGSDGSRIPEEMMARMDRLDLIRERLGANNIPPVLPVSSAPALVAALPQVNVTGASIENSPPTSADPRAVKNRPQTFHCKERIHLLYHHVYSIEASRSRKS
ncbi:unnamed protein product, partial [Mesorhabditis belari]|uniref:Uncharacterized protein n=1 Tax=Mesorhabditis belari TaxID=2138241 RepID=A0AAF3EBV1_9BILA